MCVCVCVCVMLKIGLETSPREEEAVAIIQYMQRAKGTMEMQVAAVLLLIRTDLGMFVLESSQIRQNILNHFNKQHGDTCIEV